MGYLNKPQFVGVRAAAANLSHSAGAYTQAQFREDFPQFFRPSTEESPGAPLAPEAILEQFIAQANTAIAPDKWLDGWRYACGLYTAHYLTLYLRTFSRGSDTPAQAAATGALVGVVKSATLGRDSVSYDTDALTRATQDWGDLNATTYGQMLASRARLVGMGGSYVI